MLTFNHQFDATATAEAIKSGKITSLEAVEAAIMKVEETNKFYNAVVHLYKEEALEEAKNLSDFSKPFAGVPILLKDAGQDYKGHPSTAGAELLKDNIAQVNSNFVQKVLDAGFIVIGHTNVPEFALKYISDSSFYGPVNNPVNTDYNAGGSSGGAAAALQSVWYPSQLRVMVAGQSAYQLLFLVWLALSPAEVKSQRVQVPTVHGEGRPLTLL